MDANRIAKTMLGTFDVAALREWAAWWLAMDNNANVSFALEDRHGQTPMDAVIHAWLTNQGVPREDWSSIAEALTSARPFWSAQTAASPPVASEPVSAKCSWSEGKHEWSTGCGRTNSTIEYYR
jgi:hypothetical protein